MDYALCKSVKLWAMLCRATQDGWVIVECCDKTWSTREENGKPLQYSCLEKPINSMKRQKKKKKDSLWPGVIPCLSTYKEPFCTCVVSPLSQKSGEWWSLKPLIKQGFSSLCPCHNYYLKVFTRGKHWLFTLFLFLLPFWRAKRRLIVNALTGSHLSLASENANSCILAETRFFVPHELQTGGQL